MTAVDEKEPSPSGDGGEEAEDVVDEASRESFPASDPPAFSPARANHVKQPRKAVS